MLKTEEFHLISAYMPSIIRPFKKKLDYYCGEVLFCLSENSCSSFVEFHNFIFDPLGNLDFVKSGSPMPKWRHCFGLPLCPGTQGCSTCQVLRKWGVSPMIWEKTRLASGPGSVLADTYLATWG